MALLKLSMKPHLIHPNEPSTLSKYKARVYKVKVLKQTLKLPLKSLLQLSTAHFPFAENTFPTDTIKQNFSLIKIQSTKQNEMFT